MILCEIYVLYDFYMKYVMMQFYYMNIGVVYYLNECCYYLIEII